MCRQTWSGTRGSDAELRTTRMNYIYSDGAKNAQEALNPSSTLSAVK
jgi:hypothetical protein